MLVLFAFFILLKTCREMLAFYIFALHQFLGIIGRLDVLAFKLNYQSQSSVVPY